MFLTRRPSLETINQFLRDSRDLPLSYSPEGIVRPEFASKDIDELIVAIGNGPADFARARAALLDWTQFNIGWVNVFPRRAPVAVGTVVAVQIHHLGFWSLNGCRVLYCVGGHHDETRFGYAYGTLPNHAESGEELFEVSINPKTGDVMYRIRATSRAQATLAWIGQPFVRILQARFRSDSAAAMQRASRPGGSGR